MSTIAEIQHAIQELPDKDKAALAAWLSSQEDRRMSEQEEGALLASLDKAVKQLDSGQGVPLSTVRGMVRQWASK